MLFRHTPTASPALPAALLALALAALAVMMTSTPGCRSQTHGPNPGDQLEESSGVVSSKASGESAKGSDGASSTNPGPAGDSSEAGGEGVKAARSTGFEWHYTFRPDADLARLETRVCFEGRVPARLDAQMAASRESLVEALRVPAARTIDSAGDSAINSAGAGARARRRQRLPHGARGIDLSSLDPGDCVIYVLDLAEIQRRATRSRQVRKHSDDLFLSPDFWLWKPTGSRDDVTLTGSFDLPHGMNVAVPWPRLAGGRPGTTYRIPESSFEVQIYGAFGRFETRTIELDGGASQLRVYILGDSFSTATEARLMTWLEKSARAVAAFYHGFPVSEAQIILRPTRGKEVGFASVAKGGGVSIQALCGVDIDQAELDDDWVAVHEMLHLGMPMLDGEGAWLREGLATYLEPIVRVRAGLQSPERALERLHDGFQRGSSRGSGRTLRRESADMHKTWQYWRVYWAGAAIAMLTDVALRQQGGSIDAEVRAIRDEFVADPGRKWTCEELLAKVATGPVNLQEIAGKYFESSEFPDLAPAYAALGLAFDGKGRLRVTDDEKARALREALLTGP